MQQAATAELEQPILVPVDFSATSDDALLFAVQLAECSSLPLIVLHVAHEDFRKSNSYPGNTNADLRRPLEEVAERMLRNFMVKMQQQYPDNAVLKNAGMMVVSGLPVSRIPELARHLGAGLIVMGSNGRTSFTRLIAGSMPEVVARQSDVPVAIVHMNGTLWKHSKAVDRRSQEVEAFRLSGEPG